MSLVLVVKDLNFLSLVFLTFSNEFLKSFKRYIKVLLNNWPKIHEKLLWLSLATDFAIPIVSERTKRPKLTLVYKL